MGHCAGTLKKCDSFFEMNHKPGAKLLTKLEDALQVDGMNDCHKKAQKAQKHPAFVIFVPGCGRRTHSRRFATAGRLRTAQSV
jgi:hypothetical protein